MLKASCCWLEHHAEEPGPGAHQAHRLWSCQEDAGRESQVQYIEEQAQRIYILTERNAPPLPPSSYFETPFFALSAVYTALPGCLSV